MLHTTNLSDRSVSLNQLARRKYRISEKLPNLLLVTDHKRLEDPLPAIAKLPRGAGVIFRHYEDRGRAGLAVDAMRLARKRNIRLLIGNDWKLAMRIGADGVHFAEGLVHLSLLVRRRGPKDWIITSAAHGRTAVVAAKMAKVDAILLSSVFPTFSHTDRRLLGVLKFSSLCHFASMPVYALGGINSRNVKRLSGSSISGIAAISALANKTDND